MNEKQIQPKLEICCSFCVVQRHLVSVRTFSIMNEHTLSLLTNHQIGHQIRSKWAVSLVITDDHLAFIGVYMI